MLLENELQTETSNGDSPNGMVHPGRKILVLDRRGNLTTDLADAAVGLSPPPEILRLRRTTQVVDAVDVHRPDIIIAGPEEVTHSGLQRLARVHRTYPRSMILLVPNGASRASLHDTAAA